MSAATPFLFLFAEQAFYRSTLIMTIVIVPVALVIGFTGIVLWSRRRWRKAADKQAAALAHHIENNLPNVGAVYKKRLLALLHDARFSVYWNGFNNLAKLIAAAMTSESASKSYFLSLKTDLFFHQKSIEAEKLPHAGRTGIAALAYLKRTPLAFEHFEAKLIQLRTRCGAARQQITEHSENIFFPAILAGVYLYTVILPVVAARAFLEMRSPGVFDYDYMGFPLAGAFALFVGTWALFLKIMDSYDKPLKTFTAFTGITGENLTVFALAVISVLSLVLGYFCYAWFDYAAPSAWAQIPLGLLIFLFLCVLLPVPLQLLYVCWYFFESFPERRTYAMFPRESIVDLLFELTTKLEKNKERWDDAAFKNEIVAALEKIAYITEHAWRKKLYGRDLETKEWLKNHLSEIALAFRRKKKLLLNPLPDYREKLIKSTSQSLYHMVEGNWGRLETEELATLTLREGSWLWLKRIWAGIKTVIIAAVPLILINAAPLANIRIDESYLTYVNIGGLLWFAVSLIIALDPLYSDKLDFIGKVQNFAEKVTTGGKKPGGG